MRYKYRKKKKKTKEKNELKREKWDVEKKSGVMKIEHYSKTCWSREEEARYLQLQNFGRSKTQAFFKNMEKFILSLDQIVRWVMGSFEFLTRDYFFCSLTELAWCELPGSVVSGTALWSWWSCLFQKGEVVRRCCTWSWTCLAVLDAFDVICVQKWTKLSHGAPVQLLSLILGLSSAWWRLGSIT